VGVSLYYTANRTQPLTSAEHLSICEAIARYSVDEQIEEYCRYGRGLNWESFCVYNLDRDTEPNVVFEGATKLPSNTQNAWLVGLRHWCRLLTEIRCKVAGCDWRVHVDDFEIVWDSEKNLYDPKL
jgi:hypothetical protein